ncbi:glycosyltransferase family 4 protein [Candidatus Parcubacteria bacterium]|nr:glycosyltransferase family 4 protein [Candidatus Parcubacteria bacterium]
MKKLNICYLTQQYGNFASGVGTYSTNLINSVAEQGHKVTVICPKEKKREFISLNVKLIEIKRCKCDPSHGNWFTLSFQFFLALKRLIKKEKIDIIHFTDAREFFWTNLFHYKKNRAVIIGTMHDYTFMEANCNPFFYKKLYNDWIKRYFYYNFVNIIEKICLKNLDFIISVSGHVQKKIVDVYKIDKIKTLVVYNGISLNFENHKSKKEKFILIIGNNLQRKGVITLFKAFSLIKEKYSDLQIIIIGQDINQEYLEGFIDKMGLKKRVEFKGRKSNEYVLDKMKKASIYVMPSLREGFGITFLEAMVCGTPVIGGNVGGTKELIKDDKNGFLINKKDYKNLADKISILLDNNNIRKKFVENGLKTAKYFSVEKMVDETSKIYMNISKHNEKR